MKKILFTILLGFIITMLNAIPTIITAPNNYPVFAWQDNSIYLNLINVHDKILNNNPYLENQENFLLVWPFLIINKMGSIIGIGNAYLLWIVTILLLVIKTVFEFAQKIKINPYLFSIGFVFLNPMLYLFTKIGALFYERLSGFQWTGIEWLKGTQLLLNLWHPIFLVEILITFWIINWLLEEKENEKKLGLVSLIVYFGRGYIFPIYWAIAFIGYYWKTAKINRYSILSGLIVFIHYIWLNTIPAFREMTTIYSSANHYPTFWIVASSCLLFFLFVDGFYKKPKELFYVFVGLGLSVVALILTPLNIRTTLTYTLFLNIGAAVGFATLKNSWSKVLFLFLSIVVLYFSYDYTFRILSEMVYINPWRN